MRYLVHISWPHEPFNTFVRDGSAGKKMGRIMEETKPEVVYFTEEDGQRTITAVYDVKHPTDFPKIAEPWFLTFEADVRFRILMTPDDLMASGLDELGKKW